MRVKIADLKAHLSEHLRHVKRGETITVLDREVPVAKLVPIGDASSGVVVHPPKVRGRLAEVRLPAPVRMKADVVALLLEERGER